MPNHQVRSVDTKDKISEIQQEALLELLNATYQRIGCIDLENNSMESIVTIEDEAEDIEEYRKDYDSSIRGFAKRRIVPTFQKRFLDTMLSENIRNVFDLGAPHKEVTYQLLSENGICWMCSELVPVKGYGKTNHRVMCYVRNISEQNARETELCIKLKDTNERLKKALLRERQYKQALISETLLAYTINISKNLIEKDVCCPKNRNDFLVFPLHEMSDINEYDTFYCYWRKYVTEDTRRASDLVGTCKKLLNLYETNRKEITVEYKIKDFKYEEFYVQQTILMTKDNESGDILGLCYVRDTTYFREQEQQAKLELRNAYEKADCASRAKTKFMSTMSHDIRTPMNAIIGMTSIAMANIGNDEKVEECLEKISVSSKHLLSLINNVLDMSKIEAGKLTLREEEFTMQELIDNLLTLVHPMVLEKGHDLQIHMGEICNQYVCGDLLRLQQIFINILSNAVKYTPKGGRIKIAVRELPYKDKSIGYYEFVIEDNGIGMKPEFVKCIFEPFKRAEDLYIANIPGTGLGMPIARKLVKMMEGDIVVESEHGKGSCFTVTFHLKLQDPNKNIQISKANISNKLDNPLEDVKGDQFDGKCVLLVEDNDMNRDIAVEILQMTGLSVEQAANGQEAVDMVCGKEAGYYDCVLMDIQMPVMNGYNAAKAIRQNEREDLKKLPVIAMTANAFAEDVNKAKEAGMNDHIPKPLDLAQLFSTLEKWL